MRFFVSLALVFVFAPVWAAAATIYLDPPAGTYGVGDTFITAVRLDTGGECVNATRVEIRYSPDTLKAVDFGRGGSILSLWVEEPRIDTAGGVVTFAGGIPGGYCGRIQGDPLLTNILGKIVFTVVGARSDETTVRVAPTSSVHLHDGLATPAPLSVQDAHFTIAPESQSPTNPWLVEVENDTTPPESFEVQIQSTRGVFRGKYYIIFSTIDKQSGLDHYEIFERGVWKSVGSPYTLNDQSLKDPVQVKAVDKAGNERLGELAEEPIPPRYTSVYEYLFFIGALLVLGVAGAMRVYFWYRRRNTTPPPPVPEV